ncbi:TetR/AcrR family transcriptional regulator [Thermomonospora catenispora]|uniref:TetR/AcrR family transcriptional regulator n=1 Tax=Thermomonospora catenispora TaxID=2493090 RepID=UPI00111F9DEE|nr:TetR/AcrR family transcriptional regulator [Thermomonospora catenispora]TNY37602.1 TetR/AcrR family transcriptional regulator [Thermomonospora catenispora]
MSKQAAEKAQIVEAAYRCLADTDGATASITAILTAAGLSTRAFYRHFQSKDGLLLTMFREDADRVMQELRAQVAAAPTPTEALRALIHGMLRLTADPARRRRVLVLTSQEAQRARGYTAELARFRAIQDSVISGILRSGLADGSFPRAEPDSDARFIRAALDQAFEEQMRQTSSLGPEEAAEQVCGFALRALGARPA